MKLLSSTQETALRAQYGKDMSEQMVVCRIKHPLLDWSWYLTEQDPEDESYLWGFVDGFELEIGSIWLPDLENPIKGVSAYVDETFVPAPAKEIYERVKKGELV